MTYYKFKNDPFMIFEEFSDSYTSSNPFDCSVYSGDGYEFQVHKVSIIFCCHRHCILHFKKEKLSTNSHEDSDNDLDTINHY